MKVKFIRDEEFTQETWLNENEKGQVITIHKGETFKTGSWGYGGIESVLTNKGEWICDVDCKEFSELFEILEEERLRSEDGYHYIKQGLREGIIGIYELGWKTSCDFYDLTVTTVDEIVKGLKEKYNFDENKSLVFINENIKIIVT